MKSKSKSTQIDLYFGAVLKLLRTEHGLSQVALGQKMNISFQQVQKYETGRNRLAASRIYEISKIFNVSPMIFFEGLINPSQNFNKTLNLLIDHDFSKIVKSWSDIEDKSIKKNFSNTIELYAKAHKKS